MKIKVQNYYDEALFRQLAEKYHVPGFTYTIIKNGKAEAAKAYGIRNSETQEAMTPDTIFEAASLTKTVFSLLVLRMVDRGILRLEDKLAELAPELNPFADPRSRECTLIHALSHGTGLVGWGDRFEHNPGTFYAYSGSGYYWLQHVLERVTGKEFCQSMREEILTPLEMADSYPVMCLELQKKESHKFDENGIMQPFRTWVDKEGAAEPNAAWSLYTTAQDYARFMLEILNHHGHLSEEAFGRMTSVQNRAAEAVNWGLGWGKVAQDPDVLWHWGDNGCYRSFTAMDLKTKDGVCIFCNAKLGGKLCMDLMRTLTGDSYWTAVEQFIDSAE